MIVVAPKPSAAASESVAQAWPSDSVNPSLSPSESDRRPGPGDTDSLRTVAAAAGSGREG